MLSSGIPVEWWLVARVHKVNGEWSVTTENKRAYCTPNPSLPSVPSFMKPECSV